MQLNFTNTFIGRTFRKAFIMMTVLTVFCFSSFAQIELVNESFTTAIPLPAGWAQQNLSDPAGTQAGWFQGNATVFPAAGTPTSGYIAANFNNTAGIGTISNWLFTPELTMRNGDVLTFTTRTVDPGDFPDRLEVRLSATGPSVNAGTSSTSVGDFTTVLLEINPTLTTTGYPVAWQQFTVTISGLTGVTQGRIAFRYFVTDAGPDGTNSNFMGIDDVVYTSFPTVCSGTPDAGNTLSTVTTTCPNINFTLSLQNLTMGSGVTYQWQSSTDNITYTDAPSTVRTFTTQLTQSTYYRAIVTCAGNSDTSTFVLVNLTPPSGCYCVPATTDCTDGDVITNVTLLNLNNTSTCGTNGYTNYTTNTAITVPDLVQGASIPMSVTAGGGLFTESVAVWIDFNKDGVFDASEFTSFGTTTGGTVTRNILVPATAPLGTTRMRVRVRFNTALVGGASCATYLYGETEDYTVNIVECIQGVITAQPANTTVGCNGTATFSVATTGSLVTYQWQSSSTGGPWTTITNSGPYSGATTSTLTVTNTPSAFDGTKYRVIINGPCTGIDFSSAATLTVGPLVATVDNTTAEHCLGADPVLIQVTNQGAPPATTTFTSGPLTLAIPDDETAGISHSIPVTVPSGAIITNLSVRLNVTHPWAGDMVIVLKAPNGEIFNLDYFLNGTGGGASTGFINTVISSTGTAGLNTGSGTYTGTFRADAALTGVFGPAGPDGFIPTTNTWSNLYSTPSGNWTLAIYDGGAGDLGTLTTWELDVTYGAPATGIFTPITGLFTDAAGTIAYTAGSSVSSVYAAPAVTTTYQLVVSNPLCTSSPLDILVNVSDPHPVVVLSANPYTRLLPNMTTTLTAAVTPATSANYIWYYNGVVIPGQTSSTLTVGIDQLGDYTVAVNGCFGTSSSSITIADSTSNVFFIYPNPTSGVFQVRHIRAGNSSVPRTINVYDSKGARVFTNSFPVDLPYTRIDVDMRQHGKGIYLVELLERTGRRIASGRVIIF